MSSHIVEVCTIDEVMPHPNADRLELVRVKGWVCVTGKGNFKAGDHCVYVPIDSVLCQELEDSLFPPDSKIKLHHHRVKTIKIRGHISQGMCIALPEVLRFLPNVVYVGDDVAVALGITKYEPPRKELRTSQGKKIKRKENPHFKKFTDLENIKWFPTLFNSMDMVQVTEKLHGTNFRAGWVPFVPRTWWQKLKHMFGFTPMYEFVYGSRNLQLQDQPNKKLYYETNVYAKAVDLYDLRNTIPHGYVVYGEIVGPSIQPGYHYGLLNNDIRLELFDIYNTVGTAAIPEGYLDPELALSFCAMYGLPYVPVLYQGIYDLDKIKSLTVGDSILAPTQKVIEGVVVRAINGPRRILKVIGDAYALSKHADEENAHDLVE